MLNLTLLAGLMIFAISSMYFYFAGKTKNGLNSAFLVSFVTLISYVLMCKVTSPSSRRRDNRSFGRAGPFTR